MIRLGVIKHDRKRVLVFGNELKDLEMVLRARECMVRVAEGHSRDRMRLNRE